MKRKILLAFCVLTLLPQLRSQTSLPYYTGFDDAAGQAGWTIQRKGLTTYPSWTVTPFFMPYSAPNIITHADPIGTPSQADDWFVSPAFDLSGGGKLDSLRYLFIGFSIPYPMDTVAVYLLVGSPDPSLAKRVMLKDFRGADYIVDGVWRNLTNVALPPSPGKSYIAIRKGYGSMNYMVDPCFDNLAVSAAPGVHFSASQTRICLEDQIMFRDSSANHPISWSWNFQGGTPATSSVKDPTVSYAAPGVYTVSLVSSNANGPGNTAVRTVTISDCTSLKENTGKISLSIFPNPVTGSFRLENQGSGPFTYTLRDALGKAIATGELKEKESRYINLEYQPSGIYFLDVKKGGITETHKIIRQ